MHALDLLGVDYTASPPHVDETPLSTERADEMVLRLAIAKVEADTTSGIRLAVDTTVVRDGSFVGKPEDAGDAIVTLLALAGRSHLVHSGWALQTPEGLQHGLVTTEVHFREIDATEAAAYVATGEPLDKAGSYGVQGFGARFIERIGGSLSNVMGFPAEAIVPALVGAGVAVRRPDARLLRLRRGIVVES